MTVGLAWIVGLVALVWIMWSTIGYSRMSEPGKQTARVIVGIVAAILLIVLLFGLSGHPLFNQPLFRG
jgi:DMSO/TMAO reductase YedYZ heme-binding membrane subunit